MVFSLLQNRQDKKQNCIDIRESYILWDLMATKYLAIDLLKSFYNEAHDADLKYIVDHIVKILEKHSKEVENILEKFSIVSPDKSRKSNNFPQHSEAVTDEFIAKELHVPSRRSREVNERLSDFNNE